MESVAQHLMWFVPMLWLGMVLAISFLEAPLKFRAPGVTTELGLGIGRLVFRALNTVEAVLAAVLLVAAVVLAPAGAVWVWLAIAVVILVVQLAVVRPPLSRRSDRVLAGEELPRSTAHYWYIGLEIAKVAALIGLAVAAAP
jgi:predicted membrane protein